MDHSLGFDSKRCQHVVLRGGHPVVGGVVVVARFAARDHDLAVDHRDALNDGRKPGVAVRRAVEGDVDA